MRAQGWSHQHSERDAGSRQVVQMWESVDVEDLGQVEKLVEAVLDHLRDAHLGK